MPSKNKRMVRPTKKVIFIFCEGESEQEYANFLKEEYSDVASIQAPVLGLFDHAKRVFNASVRYKNSIDVIDEIWFFFDTEEDAGVPWEQNKKILEKLKKLRKKPPIKVRLLMTKSCIEYWFLLHYEKTTIPIRSPSDKRQVENRLKREIQTYEKGDRTSIFQIAEKYLKAKENGAWSLKQLGEFEWLSQQSDDIRNEWLYKTGYTFTTVHEAIEYLDSLRFQDKQEDK